MIFCIDWFIIKRGNAISFNYSLLLHFNYSENYVGYAWNVALNLITAYTTHDFREGDYENSKLGTFVLALSILLLYSNITIHLWDFFQWKSIKLYGYSFTPHELMIYYCKDIALPKLRNYKKDCCHRRHLRGWREEFPPPANLGGGGETCFPPH